MLETSHKFKVFRSILVRLATGVQNVYTCVHVDKSFQECTNNDIEMVRENHALCTKVQVCNKVTVVTVKLHGLI